MKSIKGFEYDDEAFKEDQEWAKRNELLLKKYRRNRNILGGLMGSRGGFSPVPF